MPAYQSFVRHEHRHARRAIVQPRWGNRIAGQRVPRGTRRGREPRAMECNAFGVGAIGHIVRLRDNGPSVYRSDASGTPFGRIGYTVRMHRVTSVGCSIDWVASTNHVNIKLVFTPKALHSKAQGRRASGAPWVDHAAWNPNPNGVLQMRDARVPIVRATRISPCTSGDCPTPLG